MNYILIVLLIIVFLYFFTSQKDTLHNTDNNLNYYIDENGQQHIISKLPIELNNITELHYSTITDDKLQFITTHGYFTTSSSDNKIYTEDGITKKYQFIFLKNDNSPFSGILSSM